MPDRLNRLFALVFTPLRQRYISAQGGARKTRLDRPRAGRDQGEETRVEASGHDQG